MKRAAMTFLSEWKNKKDRKPLVVKGARQVGKTWLLKEFGKNNFKNCRYFDFEKEKSRWTPVFANDIDPKTVLRNISLLLNEQIDSKNDILIFDEIQNIPRAITSLKYFHDEMPEIAIISAGSLLGIILSDESFPVGKVEFFNLSPMNFKEFLLNYGNDLLFKVYEEAWKKKATDETLHAKLTEVMREYLITGGMPEAAGYFLNHRNNPGVFDAVRKKQRDLLNTYQADFAKHSGKNNAVHISAVYQNVPVQLASNINDSVKKFKFKEALKGKKGYTELSGPIDWLVNAELIIKIPICNRAELPLKAFCKDNTFKLYYNDIGLLGAELDLPPSAILMDDYGMSKGYFMENFAAQELFHSSERPVYAWNERTSEIEFIITEGRNIVPVEVKSGTRTKAKSLQQYILKYNPEKAYILSGYKHFNTDKNISRIPLYYAGKI